MATSALALYNILNAVSQKKGSEPFIDTVAGELGFADLDVSERNGVAAFHLWKLLERVRSDFEGLTLDEGTKKHMRNVLVPFVGIQNFTHLNQPISGARNNILKPESIANLLNLNAAMSGKSERIELDDKTKDLVVQLREIRENIFNSDLDESLREVLVRRITQMIAALEQFQFFGAENLSDEIDAIVGVLVVRQENISEEDKNGIIGELFEVVEKVHKGLAKAAKASDNIATIAENVPKAFEVAQPLITFLGGS